jgi:hypothetical protein
MSEQSLRQRPKAVSDVLQTYRIEPELVDDAVRDAVIQLYNALKNKTDWVALQLTLTRAGQTMLDVQVKEGRDKE